MELLTSRFEANEMAKYNDFNYINEREYDNLNSIFEEWLCRSTNDPIVGGLVCQERSTPSMNVDLTIGCGFCKNTSKIAYNGSLFGPIAIASGGAQNRLDTLEIRMQKTDYDVQQRAKKDPVTEDITFQDIYVKSKYVIEAQVIQGTPGPGVAPNHTSGWIKIAEIFVEANETTAIYNADIKNCNGYYDGESSSNWTAETSSTFRLKTLSDIKKIFRIKHKEDGDHLDDVIKDRHIDFGTGADQVSALDMPIADANGRITASEVENALQEFAGTGRTDQTIKGNHDNTETHKARTDNPHTTTLTQAAAAGGSLDNVPDGATYKKIVGVSTNKITKSSINADAVGDAEIDWGSSAGQVSTDDCPEGATNKYFSGKTLDNLPDGTTYKRLSNTTQTITGDKTFSNKIIDKNGNEVIAMLIETKVKEDISTGIVSQGIEDIDVTGFSFTPTAVFDVSVASWTTAHAETTAIIQGLFGTFLAVSGIKITKATPGTNKVTVRLANNDGTNTRYYRITCTAVRT